MTNTTLMFLGSYVLLMMLIGLGLTMREFRSIAKARETRDRNADSSASLAPSISGR